MRVRLSLQDDFSLVRIVNAGKNFDQGALAAAVLPSKTMYLAGTNREADIRQRANSAKTLADPAHLDELGCALLGSLLRIGGGGNHGRVCRAHASRRDTEGLLKSESECHQLIDGILVDGQHLDCANHPRLRVDADLSETRYLHPISDFLSV
jgi:hypothetical protein